MARHSLKAAPRRDVRSIERQGDWGEVTYHHHLACGHTEVRKRRSLAPAIACSGCVTAAAFAAGEFLTPPPAPEAPLEFLDDLAALETEAARVRAALAKRLAVDVEAVDVVVRGSDISHALVFLDRDAALRLATRLD